MKTDKNNSALGLLKGTLLVTILTVATACSGGGGQSALTDASVSIDANPVVTTVAPTAAQTSLKMALCDEVKGWDTDCRFVGMKYLKLNPEEVTPLTEKFHRG